MTAWSEPTLVFFPPSVHVLNSNFFFPRGIFFFFYRLIFSSPCRNQFTHQGSEAEVGKQLLHLYLISHTGLYSEQETCKWEIVYSGILGEWRSIGRSRLQVALISVWQQRGVIFYLSLSAQHTNSFQHKHCLSSRCLTPADSTNHRRLFSMKSDSFSWLDLLLYLRALQPKMVLTFERHIDIDRSSLDQQQQSELALATRKIQNLIYIMYSHFKLNSNTFKWALEGTVAGISYREKSNEYTLSLCVWLAILA